MRSILCTVATFLAFVISSDLLHAADRPNILLICVDDLKPNLGCYSDVHAQTPNLDRLAKSGVLFERAYCNQAVCSPSRNALLTSLRPQTLGIYDLPTHFRLAAPEAITLPQHFRNHGYRTEGLGKIFHVGHGNHEDDASWTVPHWRPTGSAYALPESTKSTKQTADGRKNGNATENADVDDDFYSDGKIAAEATRRLATAAQSPSEPFFLAVGFLKPHLPFVAPKKYWDKFDPAQLPLPQVTSAPVDAPSYAPTTGGELRNYADMPTKGVIDEATTRNLIHGYYAATSYTDAQIGRVLAALEANKLTDKTIVVLWGDHGWHLGDHGMWCKHTNYEQAARIPVIVSGPMVKQNKTQAMIESVDIYPTLCTMAGLPAPKGVDGVSFSKVLHGSNTQARDFVTHVYPRADRIGRAVRNERYRMVEWKVPGEDASTAEIELYDYANDPLETKNIAATNAEIVNQMRSLLAQQPEAKPQLKKSAADVSGKNAKKPQDRSAMFKRRDVDNDGMLTREEFLKNQPDPEQAPGRFLRFDINKDERLSEEEFVTSGK